MKTLIRRGCFETNSSSTHSISISEKDFDLSLPMNFKVTEILEVRPLEFGWEEEEFSDFESKLSYLLLYIRDWVNDYDKQTFTKVLNTVVSDCLGCKEVMLSSDQGYIDHQSVEGGQLAYLFEDPILLRNFIFNRDSILKTDNDNH